MSEIESVKPALTVTLDDGDFIINSVGPIGKAMSQSILPLVASAHKIVVITDGEMRVMKRNGKGVEAVPSIAPSSQPRTAATPQAPPAPDIQDQFAADLEAGVTGEAAMGEAPSPTPGPSEPVKIPTPKRVPRIYQDAAAPPAPELAEAEMDRLLAEAAQAELDVAKAAEDQRFQRQQAIQSGEPVEEVTQAEPAATKPRARTREPRQLATMGRPCGKCGGSGQTGTQDPAGNVFTGACPVCHGEGQVQTFARGPKFR